MQRKHIGMLTELHADGAIDELFSRVLESIKGAWLASETVEGREAEYAKAAACGPLRREIRKVIDNEKREAEE